MPMYKNRVPMDPATELRRYITLDALVQTLQDRQLRLTRLDTFQDPFEGSVPKRQIDDQVPIFSSRNMDQMRSVAAYYPSLSMPPRPSLESWTEMTLRRRAKTRSAHASCWRAGPEWEVMWRLYCRADGPEGVGVALQSTLGKIEESVASHDLFVSPIRYRYFHEGDAFDDELDPFMHKRMAFAHELEVRLLKYNHSHYIMLADAFMRAESPTATPSDLPEHIYLEWPLAAVIETIMISPYAHESYEKQVRDAVASIDPSMVDRLKLSPLRERYAPQF
jgi:hypothetical protein